MLVDAVQRLESRFDQLFTAIKRLKDENNSLVAERDALLRERQIMRDELDRILLRFAAIDEGSP